MSDKIEDPKAANDTLSLMTPEMRSALDSLVMEAMLAELERCEKAVIERYSDWTAFEDVEDKE